MASVQALPIEPPAMPCISDEAQYLRLHLLTPGNFGGWAPKWLLPADSNEELPWGVPWEPFPCRLQLCSAFLGAWQPLSGWDYEKHLPKAMRKIVPAGAVFVVELEDPKMAKAVAEALWLKSLCPTGSQEAFDGFGIVGVGNADGMVINNQ